MEDLPKISPQDLDPKKPNPLELEMGILDHLRELRRRLLIVIVSLSVTSCIAYSFVDTIFTWLCEPFKASFPGQSLIGTGPAEAFMIKIKVALFGGFVIGLPIIAHQVWAFVRPALYDKEKKAVLPVASYATLLFIIGVQFCYSLVLPIAFSFFYSQYASINLEPNIKISDQLSTSLTMMSSFGVMFEMPLIVYILASLGIVNASTLIGISRYAVVLIFIVSAVLTPPDIVSQFLMAAPLILLYGASILIARRAFPKEQHKESTSTNPT